MEEKGYEKKQYHMAKISAIANAAVFVVVLLCAVILVPRLLNTMNQVDAIMTELEVVTSELAEGLPPMMEDLSTLVNSSEAGITDAIEKMNAIDIETLNEAIGDLQAVIEPLARFFGR